jgi:hypothetical protein
MVEAIIPAKLRRRCNSGPFLQLSPIDFTLCASFPYKSHLSAIRRVWQRDRSIPDFEIQASAQGTTYSRTHQVAIQGFVAEPLHLSSTL